MNYLTEMDESELREQISKLQDICKTHPPTTSAWMTASELLQPLFAEMARRHGSVAA